MKTNQSVLWAINPNEKSGPHWNTTRSVALATARALKSPLTPVFVADGTYGPLASRKQIIERNIGKKVGRDASLTEPEILFVEASDAKKAVTRLSNYAARAHSQMIVSSTAARKGIKRFLMGSFAEFLVARSSTPVLLVNPTTRRPKQIRKILFASDFSRASVTAFKKLLNFAKSLRARIEVFSVQLEPLPPQFPVPLGEAPIFPNPVTLGEFQTNFAERRRLKKEGERLIKMARIKGVKASLKVVHLKRDVEKEILTESKNDFDLVALSARGSTDDTHIFGSITQQVIRNSRLPVWTYHSEK